MKKSRGKRRNWQCLTWDFSQASLPAPNTSWLLKRLSIESDFIEKTAIEISLVYTPAHSPAKSASFAPPKKLSVDRFLREGGRQVTCSSFGVNRGGTEVDETVTVVLNTGEQFCETALFLAKALLFAEGVFTSEKPSDSLFLSFSHRTRPQHFDPMRVVWIDDIEILRSFAKQLLDQPRLFLAKESGQYDQ